MNKQQKFIKAYTRNFSIIMQQAWYRANMEGLALKLNIDVQKFPFESPYLYFMRDGVEEVWENIEANAFLTQEIVKKIQSDSTFFGKVHSDYLAQLHEIEKWWTQEIVSVDKLKEFVRLCEEAIGNFVILYVSLSIEQLPEKEKAQAVEFRKNDKLFAECNKVIERALAALYPNLGHLTVYITKEELGATISKEELEKRDKGFALVPGVFIGALSFEELVNKFPQYHFEIEKGEGDKTSLKGQVAYRGKVSGRVRIVMRKEQIEATQEGEIIVSPMTTPDMVPAMHKAAAFVTDEGGITCHAAIIARELHKPCITGTKVATKMFKDGDVVEVDATKGLVTIIK